MDEGQRTLGQHIAARLVEVGVERFFGVPGGWGGLGQEGSG